MEKLQREFQKLDAIGNEEIYLHIKSGFAMEKQHREFQMLEKFGREEIYRRNLEEL